MKMKYIIGLTAWNNNGKIITMLLILLKVHLSVTNENKSINIKTRSTTQQTIKAAVIVMNIVVKR